MPIGPDLRDAIANHITLLTLEDPPSIILDTADVELLDNHPQPGDIQTVSLKPTRTTTKRWTKAICARITSLYSKLANEA